MVAHPGVELVLWQALVTVVINGVYLKQVNFYSDAQEDAPSRVAWQAAP